MWASTGFQAIRCYDLISLPPFIHEVAGHMHSSLSSNQNDQVAVIDGSNHWTGITMLMWNLIFLPTLRWNIALNVSKILLWLHPIRVLVWGSETILFVSMIWVLVMFWYCFLLDLAKTTRVSQIGVQAARSEGKADRYRVRSRVHNIRKETAVGKAPMQHCVGSVVISPCLLSKSLC